MDTRLFLALQCVQCATMQVKQQKKSSNKWVCVVCNQRQSVLHVHARGYRAADLRRFVQDANLARGRREFAPLAEPDVDWDPAAVEEEQGDVLPIEKRQTEWSEYLDDPGEPGNGCGGLGADASDGGEGIEVITELPQKRPKVRPHKAQSDVVGKRTKLSTHPNLLYIKRQQIKQGSSPRCASTTAEVQRSKSSLFGEKNGSDTSGLHCTEHDESVSTEGTTDVVVEDEEDSPISIKRLTEIHQHQKMSSGKTTRQKGSCNQKHTTRRHARPATPLELEAVNISDNKNLFRAITTQMNNKPT